MEQPGFDTTPLGDEIAGPTQVIRLRVRELRAKQGWSAERLAAEMTKVGVAWTRVVVTKLETGRRPDISVVELLALAFVLDVAPIHLLVPVADGHVLYRVTPELSTPADQAREWVRGRSPMPGQDPRRYFAEVPEREWQPPSWSAEQAEFTGRSVEERRRGER
ncbi:helix-turn-helix transcriptional regulator [Micromonospora aurantiaca (nom. illeg.)]|uniref:helix-turn-helix transcriptional regulator n=1 Tax=Micromonospora aurantiaca (nom. illeg.) TaxID=47850 RepID=UPI0033C641F1